VELLTGFGNILSSVNQVRSFFFSLVWQNVVIGASHPHPSSPFKPPPSIAAAPPYVPISWNK